MPSWASTIVWSVPSTFPARGRRFLAKLAGEVAGDGGAGAMFAVVWQSPPWLTLSPDGPDGGEGQGEGAFQVCAGNLFVATMPSLLCYFTCPRQGYQGGPGLRRAGCRRVGPPPQEGPRWFPQPGLVPW